MMAHIYNSNGANIIAMMCLGFNFNDYIPAELYAQVTAHPWGATPTNRDTPDRDDNA